MAGVRFFRRAVVLSRWLGAVLTQTYETITKNWPVADAPSLPRA
jgi:hypothetical protein